MSTNTEGAFPRLIVEERSKKLEPIEYKFAIAAYSQDKKMDYTNIENLRARWYLIMGLLETDYIIMAPILYARKLARMKILVQKAKANSRPKKKDRHGKGL